MVFKNKDTQIIIEYLREFIISNEIQNKFCLRCANENTTIMIFEQVQISISGTAHRKVI